MRRILIACVTLLIGASLVTHQTKPFFDLDAETNLPTWFSSSLMIGCALLLFAIGERRRAAGLARAWHFTGLGLGFSLMSLDEFVSLHEKLGHRIIPGEVVGPTYFNWIYPAAGVVALLSLVYVPFVLKLPRGARRQMIAAAAVFLSGSLGLELLEAKLAALGSSAGYFVVSQIEESLELIGVAIFADCLWHRFRELVDWRP